MPLRTSLCRWGSIASICVHSATILFYQKIYIPEVQGNAIFAFFYSSVLSLFLKLTCFVKVASITDQRMNFVSQAIGGVRVMKMSGWEDQIQKRIVDVREREIKQISKANQLKALNEGVFFSVIVVVSIAVFVSHIFMFDDVLTTRGVFTIMSLASVLQLELTKHFSLGIRVRESQLLFLFPDCCLKLVVPLIFVTGFL